MPQKPIHGAPEDGTPAHRGADSVCNGQTTALRKEVESLRRQLLESRRAQSQIELLTQELAQKDERIQTELAVAREFHRRLFPMELPQPEGVRVATHHVTSPKVGGEVYDAFNMGSSCLGLFMGDVSGQGLPAALVLTIARLALHTYSVNEYSPRAILEKVNRELCQNTLESQFMTAFFGVLDLETSRFKYVNASHCSPLLVSAERFELLDTEGMFCGMFDEPMYQEREIELAPGDRILFYSDGVAKVLDSEGRAFTAERLHQAARSGRTLPVDDLINAVVEDINAHLDGAAPEDDLTLLGIEIVSREAKESRVAIPSEPKLLPAVEEAILAKLNEFNYGERAGFAVRLAVEEAIINAMKHGNHMDKAKTVAVTWSVDETEAVIAVEDQGEGFNPAAVPDPTREENLEIPHGRGLVLMKAYMDEVVYNDKGNRVTLVKRAPWRA